ncbi:MAG: hypothetical protein AB1938_19685 [Myxococcota bacterium]
MRGNETTRRVQFGVVWMVAAVFLGCSPGGDSVKDGGTDAQVPDASTGRDGGSGDGGVDGGLASRPEPRLDGWLLFEADGLDGSTVAVPLLASAGGTGEESFLVVWPRETSLRAVVGTRTADGGEEEAPFPVEGTSAGEADGGAGPGLERLAWVKRTGTRFSHKAEVYVQAGKRFDLGNVDCDGLGDCDFVVPGRETGADGTERSSTLHVVCGEASGAPRCTGADMLADAVFTGAGILASHVTIPGADIVPAAVVVGSGTVRGVVPGPNGDLPEFPVSGVSLVEYGTGNVPRIADELRVLVAPGASPPPVPVSAVSRFLAPSTGGRTIKSREGAGGFRTAPGVGLVGRAGMVPERSLFSLHLVDDPARGWVLGVAVQGGDPCDGYVGCVATGRPDGGVALLRSAADGGIEVGTLPGDAGAFVRLPSTFDPAGELGFCDFGANPLYQGSGGIKDNRLFDSPDVRVMGRQFELTFPEGMSPDVAEVRLPPIRGQARDCHVYGEATDAGTVTKRVRFVDVVSSQGEQSDGGEVHLSWLAVPEDNPTRAEESLPLKKRIRTMGSLVLQWTQRISEAPDGGFRIDFQVATEPGDELVEPSGYRTLPRLKEPRHTGHVTLLK